MKSREGERLRTLKGDKSFAVSKPPTAVSAAVTIFDNTPFLKACGLHMPNSIATALGAAIDIKGNLTYRNAAGGLIVCGDTTTADPQKIQVTGAISFSKIGDPLLTSWTIIETLHDLLIGGGRLAPPEI